MHDPAQDPSRDRIAPAARLALAVLPVAAAALPGALLTAPNIPTWYAGLAKPGFTPPNALFAPVWALLYAMMACAAWRLLGAPAGPARTRALAAFWAQLALNAAWTPAFFAAHSTGGGLVVIVLLLAALAAAIVLARRVEGPAAGLLAPTLAWVAYATALNASVWWLNR